MWLRVLVVSLLASQVVLGQNQLGLHISNYAGANGLSLNPASFQVSPLSWDVNILSGGVYFENDYAFLENTNSLKLLTQNSQVLVDRNAEGTPPADGLFYNFFYPAGRINLSVNAFAGLPAGVFRVNPKFSIGIFTKARLAFSGHKLDNNLSKPQLDLWLENNEMSFKPLQVSALSWGEVAINLGFNTTRKIRTKSAFGVNIKYLIGLGAAYFKNNQTIDILPTSLNYSSPQASLQFGQAGVFNRPNKAVLGKGFGFDMGYSFKKKKKGGQQYHYQLNAALVDIGWISFNKGTEAYDINGSNLSLLKEELNDLNDLNELANLLSDGSGNSSAQSNFVMFLPAALHLSADYRLSQYFLLNAAINQRLKLGKIRVERDNLLALSARFENRWFEAGVPLVLTNYQKLRMGAWLRLGFLTIGSDNLGSLFINQNQYSGSDLYFAIRLMPGLKKNRHTKKADACYFD